MVNDRYFLINAPAGSGKTTFITNEITDILATEKESDRVLCITYTNRAADELTERVSSESVEVSTIHSFLNRFIKPFLKNLEVIQYFQSYYKVQIENEKKDLEISDFKEITQIKYNELQYSKYNKGELSHDDLLEFSYSLIIKYAVIRKKLWKYSYIFIDEYQDTSTNVLNFFYYGLRDTDSKLYLLGDRMQQIYDNYDGSFEQELQQFNNNKKLRNNYRSNKSIVALLNEIYNEYEFKQTSKNNRAMDKRPKLYIRDNVDDFLRDFRKSHPEALMLVLANRKRFKEIGAMEIFNAFNRMDDYSFGSRYNASKILTIRDENPDDLLKLLFVLRKLCKDFEEQRYGRIIRELKAHSFFKGKLLLNYHHDKIMFAQKFKVISESSYKNITIEEWLNSWCKHELIQTKYITKIMDNEKYGEIIKVKFEEFNKLAEYLEQPYVSTQHGVKGEGHKEVLFVVEEMTRGLNVRMYELFMMWCMVDISFMSFEKFYFEYNSKINGLKNEIERKIDNKITTLRSNVYYNDEELKECITDNLRVIYERFKNNEYFIYLYEKLYNEFLNKEKNWQHFKELIKTSKLKGLMNAYKLFYVGCSRAREELTVIVNKDELKGGNEIIDKFEELGFEIISNN